uniref:Putative calcineurin-like phosphoesterase n=2 Tax=viral metagenome TaxID=1070528 RepID=A0A6M3K3X3_9ZZZZ
MKILLTGDWHLRFQKPQMRLDENYFATQYGKVEQIISIAEKNDCEYILQPGDFFDSVDTPWFVIQAYISLFKNSLVTILCIPGQHDLRHHTRNIENTPLGVMDAALTLGIINDYLLENEGVNIIGCGWGSEIKNAEGSGLNILLMHKMVVEKGPQWPGQTDFVSARMLFRQYPGFDLFVCGDNHKTFMAENNGKFVVNCGSLMRANIDQVDHVPVVYIYDTNKRSLERIELKVRSVKKVLDLQKAEALEVRNEKLEAFVEGLKTPETLGLDFVENLYRAMDETGVDQDVREMAEEVLR